MQIGEILQRSTSPARAQIEKTAKEITIKNSQPVEARDVQIPPVVDDLIDNKAYRPKYRKMIAQGHLSTLIELAELAGRMATKEKPSHWFATVCAKRNWERTLDFLAKMRKVAHVAAEVAKRLDVGAKEMKVIYAAYWKLRGTTLWKASRAQEVGKDKFKFFCWLVWGKMPEQPWNAA